MATLDELTVKIKADSSQFTREMNKLGGTTQQATGRMSSALAGLAKNAAIAGTALAVIVSVRGLRDMLEAERIFMRLEGVIKATGGAAGVTADEIRGLADQLERETFFRSEDVQQAATVLATFKSISGDTFRQTISLAADMAEVFGQDLRSSATQLGKALEEPVEGLSALRRVGVTFTDAQKAVIESLVETGNKAEAQRVILKALEDQVGGAAGNASGGLAGAIDNLGDSFGNLGESIVGVVNNSPAISFLRSIADLINEVSSGIDKLTGKTGDTHGDIVKSLRDDALARAQTAKSLGHTGIYEQAMAEADSYAARAVEIEALASMRRHSAGNKPKGEEPGMTEEQRKEAGKAAEELKRNTEAYSEYLQKIREENYLLSINEKEREGVRALLEAENLAKLAHIEISEEDRQEIMATVNANNMLKDSMAESARFAAELKDKLSDSLTDIAMNFESASESALNFAEAIARTMIQRRITGPLADSIIGAIDGGEDGAGSIFSDIFSGLGFANGGRPPLGKYSVVGENGPELFKPDSAGTIIPNGGMGGGMVVNIINNAGTSVKTRESRTAAGVSLEIQIDELVAANIASAGSRTNQAMRNMQNQALIRR